MTFINFQIFKLYSIFKFLFLGVRECIRISNLQILLLCSIFLFTSCHPNNKAAIKDASPYFTHFMDGEEEKVLRGIDFNSTQEEVKKIERSKLYETTPDHLFYEFSFPKDSTSFAEYANVQYFFDENSKLDIITSDIFLNDSIQEIKLKHSLTEYYNQRYGKPQTDDFDYDVWNGKFEDKKAGKKYKYSVALKEMDNDYGLTLEYLRE